MVVHDDYIALRRLASHLSDEAALVVWTTLAKAGIAARVELGPELAGLGQIVDLGTVAGLGGLLPLGDGVVLRDFFEAGKNRLAAQRVKLVAADVIRSALHVADTQRAQQRLEERNVFEEELLLEIFRAGRDNHAPPRSQGRQEVGQGFAGAGARLDDQMTIFVESPLDGLCHLQLAAAKLIGQTGAR